MSIRPGGKVRSIFFQSQGRIHRRPDTPPVMLASTGSVCVEMKTVDRCKDDFLVLYSHTDRCRDLRWTPRESYQFMYNRPWESVSKFYADVVCGKSSLRGLFPGVSATEEHGFSFVGSSNGNGDAFDDAEHANFASGRKRNGRWARSNFKIDLSYHGGSFDGWQKQPGLNTVQGVVETALGDFVDERKAQKLKDRSLPVKGGAAVAGRTDKGVSALRQVCSFYTWNEAVTTSDIKDAINRAVPGKLRALSVSKVSRIFHPNFSAKWRHYLYIFPLDGWHCKTGINNNLERYDSNDPDMQEQSDSECGVAEENGNEKNYSFSASEVNRLLLQLEGKSLSYRMFARDTKASRSIGPPTECYVFHARAAETTLPCGDHDREGVRAMCVELVANRFLRRMVRVLVATAIREAAARAGDNALLELMEATCRRATAPPAPPDGLCLVDVGYGELTKSRCLIS